jgi:hypothetical protein
MHLTVIYKSFGLQYEAKLVYGSLFGCTSRGKDCSTCLEMADSALKYFCLRPLAAGLEVFDETAQRSIGTGTCMEAQTYHTNMSEVQRY